MGLHLDMTENFQRFQKQEQENRVFKG